MSEVTTIVPCWIIAAIAACPWHLRRRITAAAFVRQRECHRGGRFASVSHDGLTAFCSAYEHLTSPLMVFLDLWSVFGFPTRWGSRNSVDGSMCWRMFVRSFGNLSCIIIFLLNGCLMLLRSHLGELDLREQGHLVG